MIRSAARGMSSAFLRAGNRQPSVVREASRDVYQTQAKQNMMPIEKYKVFAGEPVSAFSFFLMFANIIFVSKGSVVTAIWIELLITLAISIFMVWFRMDQRRNNYDPEECTEWCFPGDPVGHSIVGTLLAFLVVFRSQIAYNMYMEGRTHLQTCTTECMNLANEVLGCLAFQVVEINCERSEHVVVSLQQVGSQMLSHRLSKQQAGSQLPARRTLQHIGSERQQTPEYRAETWISGIIGAADASKVLAEMRKHGVEHDVQLLKVLGDEAWKELGVSSAVQRARVMKAAAELPKQKMTEEQKESKNLELAFLAQEVVRLLKLYFFCVIEHIRSSEGHTAWLDASQMVMVFATDMEEAEFQCEFGCVQKTRKCEVPAGSFDEHGLPKRADTPQARRFVDRMQARTEIPALSAMPKRSPGGKVVDGRGDDGAVLLDPTRAKPLMVLMWLQLTIERMRQQDVIQPQKLTSLSKHMSGLLNSFHAIDKVDSMVLPFPYCQLLKIFMLFFCFTLPILLSEKLLAWTPLVCLFTSMGFFGLDQVGSELEQPFGLDRNDFPLLGFGKTLCNDLDQMVRTLEMTRYSNRVKMNQDHFRNAALAAQNLGWTAADLPEDAVADVGAFASSGGAHARGQGLQHDSDHADETPSARYAAAVVPEGECQSERNGGSEQAASGSDEDVLFARPDVGRGVD